MQLLHRVCVRAAAVLLLAVIGACASPGSLPAGTSIDDARQMAGRLRDEYPLAGGGTRVEVRRGRETYMLDFDAGGRLVTSRQVLTPQVFATIAPGMTQDEVLARIGQPTFVFPVGWQQLKVWSYRFAGLEGDCVVFQVSISNQTHTVTDAGPNTDPACSQGPDRS
jgi:hypothetical protein